MLNEYYVSIAKKGYGSPRVREAIITISKMISRLKLKEIVDAEDAKETMEFYNVVLQELQQVVNVTTDPVDTTVNECEEILKSTPIHPISFEELIKLACSKNQRVRYYVHGNNGSVTSYRLSDNKKLRSICTKLREHTNVTVVREKPICFRWIGKDNGDSSSSKNYSLNDLNDLRDQSTSQEQNNIFDAIVAEATVTTIAAANRNNILYSQQVIETRNASLFSVDNNPANKNNSVFENISNIGEEKGSHRSDGSHSRYVSTNDSSTTNETQSVVSIEEFFNDEPWQPLPQHSLEQSACYPIIGINHKRGTYYCKLHRKESENIYLESVEHHCKYQKPEAHKKEIMRLIDKDDKVSDERIIEQYIEENKIDVAIKELWCEL
jgi:hypothetical protein